MRRWLGPSLLGWCVVVTACGPGADEHERRGDDAYARERFADAAAAYRAALGSQATADGWAKLGAASLRVPDYTVAAEAYRELAASDALRVEEAVHGLDLAAEGAERAGDYLALRDVLLALHSVAPEWTSGGYALAVMRHVEMTPEQRLAFLPTAAAAAPDRRTADSLLLAYGDALRETEDCSRAIAVYRSVLRRTESARLEDALVSGRALCAYVLGLEALPDEPWTAEGWFLEAVEAAPETETGRLALIGLGEARSAQGDLIGAALAFQSAIGPSGEADSITIRAMQRLNDIAAAPAPGDTAVEVTP